MNEALLNELGVQNDTLEPNEKEQLRTQGFLNLGQLLSADELMQINVRLRDLLDEEGDQAGAELLLSSTIRYPKEAGADRLANLVNKGAVFDRFYTHPRVLASVHEILGSSFKLSSVNFRAAKPGSGEQKLHVDWRKPVENSRFLVCNSIWLLDDFTKQNGATRLVPGSHLGGRLPEEALEDPWDSHPDEILLIAPAGTVIVFNAHLWHGGTRNVTEFPRRAIHSYFCQADQVQQLDQSQFLRRETRERLSKTALRVLGIDSS